MCCTCALLGAAVADDRAFDFGRGVFHDRNARFDRGQHRDAARMSELQRTAYVHGVKQVFDRDALGAMFLNERRTAVRGWSKQLLREATRWPDC